MVNKDKKLYRFIKIFYNSNIKEENSMKCKLLTIILLSTFVVTGCNKKSNNESNNVVEDTSVVMVNVPAMFVSARSSTGYDVSIHYEDNYFLRDANTYDGGLALLSLGSTFSSIDETKGENFYDTMGYDHISFYGYEGEPTEDSVAFTIAHKKVNESDLVALSIRGFDYKKEWANNLIIGKEGDHNGWALRTNEVYAELKTYLSEYSNLKLWITGYSRGGAIANMLSSKIIKSEEIEISNENMYVYTFETPRGLLAESAVAYENVHNVVNEADAIAKIAPSKYGLYRCGTDQFIYSENVDELLRNFDRQIKLDSFVPKNGSYADDITFSEYFINELFKEQDDENKAYSIESRTYYVDNMQPSLAYFLGMVFSLKGSTLNDISNGFQSMTMFDMMALYQEDGLYNFLKPYIDEDGYPYEEDEMKYHCDKVFKFLSVGQANLLATVLGEGKNNVSRMLAMHYPETSYVLLKYSIGQ